MINKKSFNRIISFVLAFLLIMPTMPGSAESYENDAEDAILQNVIEFIRSTEIIAPPVSGSMNNTYMNRAEFAQLIYKLSGANGTENASVESEDDDWLWKGEASGTTSNGGNTIFYDVSGGNEYAEAITFVAKAHYMGGDGKGYFKPNDAITGTECIKVFVALLNADRMGAIDYPLGYIDTAYKLGILQNINMKDFSMKISARDVYVMMFNALNTEPYITEVYGGDRYEYDVRDGYMLMSKLFGLYDTIGVVDGNRNTDISKPDSYNRDIVKIDGVSYDVNTKDFDDLIGYRVKAYYRQENPWDDKTLLYAQKYKNEELCINADEIHKYEKPNFKYYVNEKIDKIKVTGTEDVIYNDKIIRDWDDNIFEPYSGSITFIDNNRDGNYDVIKIDSYEVVFVSSVSPSIYTVTDTYSKKSYTFEEDKYKVYDSNGNDATFDDISKNNVLMIKQTTDKQGDAYAVIKISDEVVVGTITSINDEIITIDDTEYYVSESCTETLKVGRYGAFYLTADRNIAGFTSINAEYACYGYTMTAKKTGTFDEEYMIKLYTENNEIKTHKLAKNVIVNDTTLKAEKAFEYVYKDDMLIPQLIYYQTNAEGEISAFDTADGNVNGFVSRNTGAGTYKSNPKAIYGALRILYFADAETKIMTVGKDDTDNEKLYSISKSFVNDNAYRPDRVYFPKKNSSVADILLSYVTEEQTNITDSATPLTLVSKVTELYENEESIFSISGYQRGSLVTIKCNNETYYSDIKSLKPGDAVRIQKNALGYLQSIKKVYDIQTHKLVGSNKKPYVNDGTGNVGQQAFFTVHAMGWNYMEENNVINVMPYDYNTDAALVPQSGEENLFMFDGSKYTVTICDTTAKETAIYTDSYKNIVMGEKLEKGDELLIYSRFGDGRDIIIIR